MNDIVIDLQTKALDETTSVSALLRVALAVAEKLDIQDIISWIESELNGYDSSSLNKIPEYRKSRASIFGYNPYQGWKTITLESREYEHLLALLDVSNTLNEKFRLLANMHNLSIDTIWAFCDLARHSVDSCNYFEKADNLELVLSDKFDEIEDSVLEILENTHRCSSMVENFNSRLRPTISR